MKISAVKTYLVEGIKYNWTLVKVETMPAFTAGARRPTGPVHR